MDNNINIYKIINIILLCLVLTSCYRWQSTNNPEIDEKKTRAAKINIRLGMAYLERNDISRAKHKFLLALDEAPDIPEPWYGMGYFMESTGNIERAEQYYLKAVRLAPIRGDALNNYGTYLCRRGDYQHSIQYFIEATRDPQYLDPAAAYENAGICALKIPDKRMALQFFKRVILEDPQRPNTLIELADLNYQFKNYALAKRQIRQFLQLTQPTARSYLLEEKIDAKLALSTSRREIKKHGPQYFIEH